MFSSEKRLMSAKRPPRGRVAPGVRTTAVFALAFALIATAAWMPPRHAHPHALPFSAVASGTKLGTATEASRIASLPRPPRPKLAPSSRLGGVAVLDDGAHVDGAESAQRGANDAFTASASLRKPENTPSLLVYASSASRTRGQPTSA